MENTNLLKSKRAALRRRLLKSMFAVIPAVLLLSLAVPEALAIATSGKPVPRAPVITELFKPVMACHPATTVGQEGCGEHKVLADDAQLNADVRAIFGLLSGVTARRDFIRAQTTWLVYRHADCTSQADVYRQGTELPVAYVYCLASDDISRRQDLKEFYRVLTQGLDRVPKFP